MGNVLMFDLGGVLIVNEMFEELPKIARQSLPKLELRNKLLRSEAMRSFELGKCSPEAFAIAMVDEFQLTVSASEFASAFARWPTGFYEGATELLSKLRKQHVLGCLSNSNELHWTAGVTSHFDHAYSSHELHKIKPDANVFEFVTRDIGCRPEEISFFDDSRLNVEAAQAFGWSAYLTDGYGELLRVLDEIGINHWGQDQVSGPVVTVGI